MTRPTSFRLPEELLERIDQEAEVANVSITSLVTSLLDEGLNTRRFPGIVYRDGPAGRRAALIGGPDIWEVIRAVNEAPGKGEQRMEEVAEAVDLPLAEVRLAVDFYSSNPDAIDRRIETDEREAQRIRTLVERREHLLSS